MKKKNIRKKAMQKEVNVLIAWAILILSVGLSTLIVVKQYMKLTTEITEDPVETIIKDVR